MQEAPILLGRAKQPKPDGIFLANGDYHPLIQPTQPPAAEPPQPQKPAQPPPQPVDICRSFSRKLNLQHYGGPQYESADFFCSRKLACDPEAAAEVSASLLEECIEDVTEDMNRYIAKMKRRIAENQMADDERRVARVNGR